MTRAHIISTTAQAELYAAQRVKEERLRLSHHPLPLAIVIQFWEGDAEEAFQLARLIADIEPERRDDVLLVLGYRRDISLTTDEAMEATADYCGNKLPIMCVQSGRLATGHPDGCFALWAGLLDKLTTAYYDGFDPRLAHIFMCEPDGVPTSGDWIDRLKRAHELNLVQGFRVSGFRHLDTSGTHHTMHVNGTLVMAIGCWRGNPDLHQCPPGQAWDYVHAPTLMHECGPATAVYNAYGATNVSFDVWQTWARDYPWVANLKDNSGMRIAQETLAGVIEDECKHLEEP